MKLYKEMLRKTAAVGIPLLAVTLIFTLVNGGQACFGESYITQSRSAIGMMPILQYYVFSAAVFALYGFSFLFSRKASDVYHSLPVKRSDLYFSVTFATASWMGATILINVLLTWFMLLISGCPFVPAYIPLSILYYFVASMLVFSAAAVGCALSGTVITALASTGIILFLPRFVQFMFARGIVERVPIIGWLDFGALLDPTTNAATGIAVTHLRPVFTSRLITMPHILYSLIPMLVMMGIGYWLFSRRQSEIAQKNGGNRIWTVTTAILLAFTVMMPLTMEKQSAFSLYGIVLIVAALAVFFVYQLIVSTKLKQALKTLPFFLLALLPALGVSLLIDTAADSMLDTAPAADEIKWVTFRGYDQKSADPEYTTLLIREIEFSDDETKEYVAQALGEAVEKLHADPQDYYYDYNQFKEIEAITIKLINGKTIKRTIEFMNIDELNELRNQNEEFAQSIQQYPPMESIQYLRVDNAFTREENEAIYNSYLAEAVKHNLVNGYYYRSRVKEMGINGDYTVHGDNQTITGMTAAGYIGTQRYNNSITLRLEAPETIALLMRTFNAYIEGDPTAEILEIIDSFQNGEIAGNDSLNVSINAYNYPNENGLLVQHSESFYMNQHMLSSEYAYDVLQRDYITKYVDVLSRAVKTDDPSGMFIRLNWSYYDSTVQDQGRTTRFPVAFLRFENETDEQAFFDLIDEWNKARRAV